MSGHQTCISHADIFRPYPRYTATSWLLTPDTANAKYVLSHEVKADRAELRAPRQVPVHRTGTDNACLTTIPFLIVEDPIIKEDGDKPSSNAVALGVDWIERAVQRKFGY